MAKTFQRKKPGHTKSGLVKIVSLNVHQLAPMLDKTSKPKERAKIERRLKALGWTQPAPVVEKTPAE